MPEEQQPEGRAVPPPEQACFWTRDWQDAERLAEVEFLSGDSFQPKDADDLLRWLRQQTD